MQAVACTGTSGQFRLYFKGQPTPWIKFSASPSEVMVALESIPGVLKTKITSSIDDASVCQSPHTVLRIEFLENFGYIPPLVGEMDAEMAVGEAAVTVAVKTEKIADGLGSMVTSISGTKEADVCAGRGFCMRPDGLCACYQTNGDAFDSSNGYGLSGDRGDCGFKKTTDKDVAACPGDLECSGHGVCDKYGEVPSYRCSCANGWTGGDCSERSCPQGKSWFQYPSSDGITHTQFAECSNMGACDIATGQCKCRDGFTGQACEYSMCGGPENNPCHGNGLCLTMSQAAQRDQRFKDVLPTTYGADPNNKDTWDGHRIQHCLCDEGFFGYDCSLQSCPIGDDPETYEDKPERQILKCTAASGTFKVAFRGVEVVLRATDTASAVKTKLETSPVIDSVSVQFVHYDGQNLTSTPERPLCIAKGGDANHVVIDFDTVYEH